MQLNWTENNGDATAEGGNLIYPELWEIEQAGPDRFWTFKNGKPCGIYHSMDDAKARCQALQNEICGNTPEDSRL